ncbi:phosphoribosylaminoimidazolesuccinocarboxamide synthase [Candidatus Calescamantes bacterium]|nr:phosphoribosylaminoimidazolesuccinocarboxamide synthase [Candidatus Calescamantes bacterium]
MGEKVVYQTDLEGIPLFKRGKVRDIYEINGKLLIVASDRISAFDVILPTPIPDKGKILTAISCFWFKKTTHIIKNHLITCDVDDFPKELTKFREKLEGRSMLVTKTSPIPIECVVRGYLAGSAWKEYEREGEVQGLKLPSGLKKGDRLPHPIFTPTTKEEGKHDRPLTFNEVVELIGEEKAEFLKMVSLKLYEFARNYAEERGIIISDTKFEFGEKDGEIILIDELLTPDSSRFWPKEAWTPGKEQISFDKQFVRDFLENIGWDKTPPAPTLPPEVVDKTREKYLEALRRLTGSE